ncbi:hypothetical protein JCM1840_005691 [Sporobolomyces johnsonii]
MLTPSSVAFANRKIKCDGEQPSCRNCTLNPKAEGCHYKPVSFEENLAAKERKRLTKLKKEKSRDSAHSYDEKRRARIKMGDAPKPGGRRRWNESLELPRPPAGCGSAPASGDGPWAGDAFPSPPTFNSPKAIEEHIWVWRAAGNQAQNALPAPLPLQPAPEPTASTSRTYFPPIHDPAVLPPSPPELPQPHAHGSSDDFPIPSPSDDFTPSPVSPLPPYGGSWSSRSSEGFLVTPPSDCLPLPLVGPSGELHPAFQEMPAPRPLLAHAHSAPFLRSQHPTVLNSPPQAYCEDSSIRASPSPLDPVYAPFPSSSSFPLSSSFPSTSSPHSLGLPRYRSSTNEYEALASVEDYTSLACDVHAPRGTTSYGEAMVGHSGVAASELMRVDAGEAGWTQGSSMHLEAGGWQVKQEEHDEPAFVPQAVW